MSEHSSQPEPLSQAQAQAQTQKAASPCLRIAIDCHFEAIMKDKQKISLRQQIMYSYGLLRRLDFPTALTVWVEHADYLIHPDQAVWDIDLSTSFEAQNAVYLSADAEDCLEEIDSDTTYLVGGLVDRNRHKGICLERANDLGIPVVKLRLDPSQRVRGKTILTVNQVIEQLIALCPPPAVPAGPTA